MRKKLLRLGAQFDSCSGVLLLCFERPSHPAWIALQNWTAELGEEKADPFVRATVDPTLSQAPMASQVQICSECNSIIQKYAPLRMSNFAASSPNHPVIQGFVALTGGRTKFHHAQVATTLLLERIANPRCGRVSGGSAYQAVCSLAPGHYICTVEITWARALTDVHVFRT